MLSAMGLRLSPEKTAITHIDEGLDFLGWRIQRRRKRGTSKHYVYTYPARKSVASVTTKVKTLCRQNINLPLEVLLHRLNSLLRGWTTYFRPGVSSATFSYLRAFTWRQVVGWLRRKHSRITWKELRRRFFGGGWWPTIGEVVLFNPAAVATTRYRYRGTQDSFTVAERRVNDHASPPQRACGEPDASTRRTSGSEGGAGKRTGGDTDTAPRADPTMSTCASRTDEAVPAGDDRGARRRPQGAGSAHRRLPRGRRVVGRSAASIAAAAACAPRCWPPGTGRSDSGARCARCSRETREQRCWFHKISNVLAALPKSAHPGAKKALAEIWNAEDKSHARDAVKEFESTYGAKFPKAVAKISDDVEQLLAFYDFPAEHWIHLRTTNPIESTFATVRNRSKITKGPGSRAAGIAMAYKLIEAAQSRWRAVNAPHLVALVRAGAKFENGKLVERPDDTTATEEAA